MRQLPCYGDARNKGFCVHCGGEDETRDHAPSKILLDDPLPDNLPVASACYRCNNGFSRDEEYLACLLECVVAGEVEPDKVERPKVARILRENQNLAIRLRKRRRVVDGQILWDIESDRVRNVLLKLARGHAAYELNEPQLEAPRTFYFEPLSGMSPGEPSFERRFYSCWS